MKLNVMHIFLLGAKTRNWIDSARDRVNAGFVNAALDLRVP